MAIFIQQRIVYFKTNPTEGVSGSVRACVGALQPWLTWSLRMNFGSI